MNKEVRGFGIMRVLFLSDMKDYTGIKFNQLTAVKFIKRENRRTYWEFKCVCGNNKTFRIDLVISSNTNNCGCSKKPGGCKIGSNLKYDKNYHYSFLELLKSYKKSALQRGLIFKITEEQFKILTKGNCNYCGVAPSKVTKTSGYVEYIYNGIDRVNNSVGYEIDNLVSCCETCNKAKRNLSIIDFKNWLLRLTIYNFKIMAEDKKGIIVYADWIDKFEELEDDEAGRLIKHFFRYVNDLNPTAPDRLTKICFVDIQNQLKRDLKKWECTVEGRSYNGRLGNLKRWNTDLYNEVVSEKTTLEEAEIIAKHRKVSPTDKNISLPVANIAVNDNVIVNVTDTDILLKKETKEIFSFKKSLIDFGFEENLVDEWLKVRKTKKATNTETAFKKFINQVKLTNAPINEVLELCVTKSWSGFETDWFKNAIKEKGSAEKEKPVIGRMTQSTMESNFMKFANVKIPGIDG